MPKERRDRRSSKNADENKAKTESFGVENKKEWREARCPVCIEDPHNAVLLICSSHENGCRPYMCDTSFRQSNCLDQFLKLAANESSTEDQEEVFSSASHRRRNLSKLVCPLCRGQISNWIVVEPAREFMNSQTRSCSLETCDFVGNYSEIRKHARCEHPNARPMDMDPTRQLDWERLERQSDLQDLDSALENGDEFEYEDDEQGRGGRSSPIHQPMEMDPTRQLDWERLEHRSNLQDLDSALENGDDEQGRGGRSSPIHQPMEMNPPRQHDWERSQRRRTDLFEYYRDFLDDSEYEYDDEVGEGGGGRSSSIGHLNTNLLIRGNRRLWRTGNSRHTNIRRRESYVIRDIVEITENT